MGNARHTYKAYGALLFAVATAGAMIFVVYFL
jgi:hypothetical protein